MGELRFWDGDERGKSISESDNGLSDVLEISGISFETGCNGLELFSLVVHKFSLGIQLVVDGFECFGVAGDLFAKSGYSLV